MRPIKKTRVVQLRDGREPEQALKAEGHLWDLTIRPMGTVKYGGVRYIHQISLSWTCAKCGTQTVTDEGKRPPVPFYIVCDIESVRRIMET